jgi:hypothetical protein
MGKAGSPHVARSRPLSIRVEGTEHPVGLVAAVFFRRFPSMLKAI